MTVIIFWIIAAVVLLVLLGAFVVYELTFAPKRLELEDLDENLSDGEQYEVYAGEIKRLVKENADIPFEDVWIETEDGLRLHGKYYHTADGAPVQIMFHGYRSLADFDFCAGLPFAIKSGYNVLLVDQRAHGQSEGKCITFGVEESEDCVEWVNYALYRFGKDARIILFGISMGASTVLMATELGLPENVEAIIADCGYTSPKEIIQKVMRERHLPVFAVYPLASLAAKCFGGFGLNAASAQKAMRRCNIPVLFIHGEDDRFVPCQMSRKNFRSCRAEGRRLLLVPGAGHALSYLADKDAYREAVISFLRERRTCLKQ